MGIRHNIPVAICILHDDAGMMIEERSIQFIAHYCGRTTDIHNTYRLVELYTVIQKVPYLDIRDTRPYPHVPVRYSYSSLPVRRIVRVLSTCLLYGTSTGIITLQTSPPLLASIYTLRYSKYRY